MSDLATAQSNYPVCMHGVPLGIVCSNCAAMRGSTVPPTFHGCLCPPISLKEPLAGETMTQDKIFWDEWFYVVDLPDDLKSKLSAYDLHRLGYRAIRAMKKGVYDMSDITITLPPYWLASVVKLLNEMAGEGICMVGCDDPAELMVALTDHNGLAGADDPWQEIIERLESK